jgi:hypothetical protein
MDLSDIEHDSTAATWSPHSPVWARNWVSIAAALAIAAASMLVGAGHWEFGVSVAFITIFIVALVVTTKGKAIPADHLKSYLLIFWFATNPICSFFIRFPIDKSVVTFNRVLICGLALWLIFDEWGGRQGLRALVANSSSVGDSCGSNTLRASRTATTSHPITATRFEIAFGLLAAVALISVATQSINVEASARTAVDSLVLPLVVFRVARRWLNREGDVRLLAFAAVLLSIFLLLTGGFELLTGVNLFPYKGSELLREGEVRVNGPFVADVSYALVSLLLAVFLLGAPRILESKMGPKARVFLAFATLPALIAALLPLFRAVVLALGVCWVVIAALGGRARQENLVGSDRASAPSPDEAPGATRSVPGTGVRVAAGFKPLLIAGIILALFVGASLAAGGVATIARLTSARNLLGRVATQQVAAKIWWTHPLFGVGLGNYTESFAEQNTGGKSYLEMALDTHVANTPHSNVFWIASELGTVGLVLYLLANFYLFASGYRALRRAKAVKSRAAAVCYLAILIAYWIPGLGLATAAYWDVNLYYFCMLGMLSSHFADQALDLPDLVGSLKIDQPRRPQQPDSH